MQKINKFFEFGVENPQYLVVFLHGYGSNGEDLISLAHDFQSAIPNAHFISPNAPLDLPHPFFEAYQWFELYSMEPQIIFPQIIAANNVLDEFIFEQLKRFNLSYKNLILLGFSQGAMMSLYNSIRRKEEIAGVLALSGRLILPSHVGQNDYSKPNICLIHGNQDPVVPFSSFTEAKNNLTNMNFNFEAHEIDHLGHSINIEVVRKCRDFLQKISS